MDNPLEILEAINNFYSQSFDQLITITIGILAFAGILLPIINIVYQKRLFKLENQVIEKALTEKMQVELNNAIKSIQLEYQEKESDYENKITDMKKQLLKELNSARGGISHVQGNHEIKQGHVLTAFDSFVQASSSYIDSDDNLNLRRVLSLIYEDCLPEITDLIIEQNSELFGKFEEMLELLKKYNKKGIFSDQISVLNQQYSNAKKRTEIENETDIKDSDK